MELMEPNSKVRRVVMFIQGYHPFPLLTAVFVSLELDLVSL